LGGANRLWGQVTAPVLPVPGWFEFQLVILTGPSVRYSNIAVHEGCECVMLRSNSTCSCGKT
jgi:hypothetical protein